MTIDSFTAGDDLEIERTITGLPSGQTIETAWFTIKKRFTDLDEDAVYQAAITDSSSDEGIITHVTDGTDRLTFYLLSTDTELLNPAAEYVYDIQIKTSAGYIKTVELNVLTTKPQVTRNIL